MSGRSGQTARLRIAGRSARENIIARSKQQARNRRQVSRQRAQTAQIMRQMGEKKGVDTVLTTSPVLATTNTNTSMVTLNLVSPGTGSYNRVGRKISMMSVRLRGMASLSIANAATTGDIVGNVLRMVVVYDKQPSGTVPTFDTIFGSTDISGTESTNFLDPVKYDNMARFQVLRDTVIDVNPQAHNAEGGTTDQVVYKCSFDEYLKLGGRETVYSGQSVPCTIADVSSGALYVFFRADSNTSPGSQWTIEADSKARLRYTD